MTFSNGSWRDPAEDTLGAHLIRSTEAAPPNAARLPRAGIGGPASVRAWPRRGRSRLRAGVPMARAGRGVVALISGVASSRLGAFLGDLGDRLPLGK
jgi:hypothetical protein